MMLLQSKGLNEDKFTKTLLRECKNVTRESLFTALLGGLINDPHFGEINFGTISSHHIGQITAKITSPVDGASFKWVVSIGQRLNLKGTENRIVI